MSKRSCLAFAIGFALFATSAAVPGKAFAAVADLNTTNAGPLDTATLDLTHRRLAQRRGGGGGRSGGRAGGRPSGGGGAGTKPGGRPGGAKPGGPSAKPGGRGAGGSRNVNVNVNVRHRSHGWRGRRWGAVAFGVTMGAIIVVAANTPPLAPDPSLCWTWTNAALTSGYWYYCDGD